MKKYNAVANIYAKDKGPIFSRPKKTTVEAENPMSAVDAAVKEFNEYCNLLYAEHGKEFIYTELDVQEDEGTEE